jgi:hypothetical protein
MKSRVVWEVAVALKKNNRVIEFIHAASDAARCSKHEVSENKDSPRNSHQAGIVGNRYQ